MGQERVNTPITKASFRGLVTSLSDVSLSPRESRDLQNVLFTEERLDVRFGGSVFSTTQMAESGAAKAGTGIFQANLGGTVHRVVTSGTKIYSMSSAGVLSDITGSVVITDNQDNLYQFVKFKDTSQNDIIIGCNGVDAPWKWTGSGNAAALGGSPGNLANPLVFNNRLWGTIDDFFKNSDIRDGETYDGLDIGRLESDGFSTNDITATALFGNGIALGKEDGIWLFTGEKISDFTGFLQRMVTKEGPAAGTAFVEVTSTLHGNILIFINRHGELRGFNGTKNLIKMSDLILPTLQSYNKTRASKISAVVWDDVNNLFFNHSAGSATEHNRLISYDYFLDGINEYKRPESVFGIHTGINANAMGVLDISGSKELFTLDYDGWVIRHQETQDKDPGSISQIAATTGLVRSSNVVTVTTSIAHGFEVGDEVTLDNTEILTGSGSFDGTFTVASAPTSTTFTFEQTAADATGENGRVYKRNDIAAYWESGREAFGNAGLQKQLNDFSIVTANVSGGSIKTTVRTDRTTGINTSAIESTGPIYGTGLLYGAGVLYTAGSGIKYTGLKFDTGAGDKALEGRYFVFRFENVDGFRFSIEEFIAGVASLGYQNQYEVA